jgi:putative ABC transport system ATP-binding protein
LPLLFARVPRRQRRQRAREVLDSLALADRLDHLPNQLSGGEQQRVALARALVNNPDILLADEPTGNLDSATAQRLVDLLADLNRSRQLTIIMISHEIDLLRRAAHRLLTLKDGRIVADERLR